MVTPASDFISTTVQLLALTTPPAVLSAYLGGTRHYSRERKRATALRTGMAVFIIALTLFLFGESIFSLFGFTLDAFRIGSGCLLFLTAVALMNDKGGSSTSPDKDVEDISVVPLAIPICMGPASIGTVMVLGAAATTTEERLQGAAAMFVVAAIITLTLLAADKVEKVLRRTGLAVLSKLTGLLLAAIAAQVVCMGIKNFMAS